MNEKHTLTNKIVGFIKDIGIPIRETKVPKNSFLPGISIERGAIHYDVEVMKFPGDLLHEAGHLALMTPEDRSRASGDLEPGDAVGSNSLEIGVILWTYAAIIHLNLEPEIVFHEEGYKDSSQWHIDNFTSRNYIGLPLLQWMGLCKHQDDKDDSIPEFPYMQKWLRE